MALVHAKPGEIVDVKPHGADLTSSRSRALVIAKDVLVIRLMIPAGKVISEHQAKGEIVVHCLEGRVAFTAFGTTRNLEAGQLFYLPTGEPHSVQGIKDALLLLTILLPQGAGATVTDPGGFSVPAQLLQGYDLEERP